MERVNPLLKFAMATLFTGAAWYTDSLVMTGALALALLVLLLVARPPGMSAFIRGLAPVAALVTGIWAVAQGLARHSAPSAALASSLIYGLRFGIAAASFWTAVWTTDAGSLLAALSVLPVPGWVVLVPALVVGLIPLLRDEYAITVDAQRARGIEYDRGPVAQRLRRIMASGVPLLVRTLFIAEAVTTALALGAFPIHRRRSTWRRVGWLSVEMSLTAEEGVDDDAVGDSGVQRHISAHRGGHGGGPASGPSNAR